MVSNTALRTNHFKIACKQVALRVKKDGFTTDCFTSLSDEVRMPLLWTLMMFYYAVVLELALEGPKNTLPKWPQVYIEVVE